jgi:hypothetical protein
MIATDETKCLTCRWRDRDNVQCFDGHLQYSGRINCEGFEYPPHTTHSAPKRSESALNTSDDKI